MPRKVEQLVSDYLSLPVELEAKIWRARSEDVDEQRERPIASGRATPLPARSSSLETSNACRGVMASHVWRSVFTSRRG
jgi:hypothetical protein